MNFVFSPSNIMTYRTCPRRFMGQSISKEIKWKFSTQKSRGTLVHSSIEKAMQDGWDAGCVLMGYTARHRLRAELSPACT